MGLRYVWGRYTAVPQTGQRKVYYVSDIESIASMQFHFTMTDGQTYQIGQGYTLSESTGKFYLSDVKTYVYEAKSGVDRGAGYMVEASGAMYFGEHWTEHPSYAGLYPGKPTNWNCSKYITSTKYVSYTYYVKGSFIEYASNAQQYYYPSNSNQDGYYYVLEGSDNIDPQDITLPNPIDDGTTIQITVTPSAEKVYSGTVSYTYQYRYDSSWRWQTLTTTTALTASLQVPKNTYQTLEVRVQAQDNLGFTSSTWVSSGVKNIIANQPPTAPGITVDNVYINQHLTVTLTPATDPDGTVASYIIQRRIDGGQWNQVQSGTSMTYSETVLDAWGTVAYRAAALDNEGLQGPWATSQTFDVNPGWVIISGPDSDLGERPGPFVLEFEVEVVGNPDQDSIVTKVMLDDRDLIVDLLLHDEDIVRIYFNTKYFAAGTHTVQVTASKEDYTPAMSVYTFNIPPLNVDLFQGAKVEVPQNAQGQPVAWQGLARCILGDDGRDVIQMCGDGLKIMQGSYVGTGTFGQSNTITIATGFRPQLFVIFSKDSAINSITTCFPIPLTQNSGDFESGGMFNWTAGESSFSWYGSDALNQFNVQGSTYNYLFIG